MERQYWSSFKISNWCMVGLTSDRHQSAIWPDNNFDGAFILLHASFDWLINQSKLTKQRPNYIVIWCSFIRPSQRLMLYILIHNESLLCMVSRVPLKLGVCVMMYYIFVQICYYGKTRDGHFKRHNGGHDQLRWHLVFIFREKFKQLQWRGF